MKKHLFLFLPLILSSCSLYVTPSNRNSNNDEERSNQWADVDKDLSEEEFRDLMSLAVLEEKDRMVEFNYDISCTDNSIENGKRYTRRYNDGYCEGNFAYYSYMTVYMYSTSNYVHNYYVYETNGELGEGITDYTEETLGLDPYVYAYGYGQLVFCPASFISCYSSSIIPSMFHVKNSELTFIMDGYADIRATLNSRGGISSFHCQFIGNMAVAIEGTVSYGQRENAPQKLVDIFKDYH